MTLHVLLVGIDTYPDGASLRGAVRDAVAVRELLDVRFPGARIRELHDEAATLAAVRSGLTDHLGAAGPGDRALFWFSGHGSEAELPAGSPYLLVEATGRLQTLVCADSRDLRDGRPVGDLPDKELDRLLDAVEARGVDVTVVLDCCHSAGATRGGGVLGGGVRALPPGRAAPSDRPVPEWSVRERSASARPVAPRGRRLLLAACRIDEPAREVQVGRRVWHGVFTRALLEVLSTAGPADSARDLLSAARIRMRDAGDAQTPVCLPEVDGPADVPFLGGPARRPERFTARAWSGGWEIDAGTAHGVPATGPGREVVFRTTGPDGVLLRAVASRPDRTVVEPVGARVPGGHTGPPLARDRAHPVRLVRSPAPRLPVRLVGAGPALDLIRRALAAAPEGPATLCRSVDDPYADGGSGPQGAVGLWVEAAYTRDGPVLRILRDDGTPATDDVPGHTPAAAAVVVERLAHIARWGELRSLTNPVSGLGAPVRIEVLRAGPGSLVPDDGTPIRPDRHGDLVVEYAPDGTPPRVFVRLRNRGDRNLWCVLVWLNSRYGASTELYPGKVVKPGLCGDVREGRPVTVGLPRGRAVVPGASVRDHLLAVVGEAPLNTVPYRLPDLGAPSASDRAGAVRFDRDTGPDWTTTALGLVTRVPG